MANTNPNKSDIESVFLRLRTIPANKMCFDCNAKNPTWASVTYGVFICIDCSAVHRGLGVHLTFVRSTQLDTNWTWVQLRQMQLGGNANATQFFAQHNCVTTDAPKKYNSRAAQLYRDKIHQLALQSLQTNPDKLHIHQPAEEKVEEKDVDFFEEHEKNDFLDTTPAQLLTESETNKVKFDTSITDSGQPNVDFDTPVSQGDERKPTIGVRKIQPKKSGLGAKKGLGATKVKANFADIEREAVAADEARSQAVVDAQKASVLTVEDEEQQVASVRLAYQDLSVQQKRHEEKLKKIDPKKAQQVERLGMGFTNRSGVSHSVLNDMQTIEQENLQTNTSTLSKLGRVNDTDGFFDDFSSFSSSSFSMNRSSSGYGPSLSSKTDSIFADNLSRDWVIEPITEKARPLPKSYEKPSSYDKSSPILKEPESDIAQKKFGSAKGISSDQFFNNRSDEYETSANLNRFQGSTSISSSDFFGTKETSPTTHFHPPDLDDVRESVRQGVTKVAGKLSSLANGVMSSIQDKYGY